MRKAQKDTLKTTNNQERTANHKGEAIRTGTTTEGHVCSGVHRECRSVGSEGLSWADKSLNAEISLHRAADIDVSVPYVDRVSISRGLRSFILDRYPILADHAGHRAFFGYLLFTSFRGKANRPVLKAEHVAECYGALGLFRRRYINAVDLLRGFQRDVLPGLVWTDYKPAVGCREAYETGIDSDILLRVEEELHTQPDLIEDPVHWQTGRMIDAKKQTQIRKKQLAAVQDFDKPADVSRRWAEYLNSRSARLFNEVHTRFADAWQVASSFTSRKRREGALRHLHSIEVQPKPVYRYSERSVRVVTTDTVQTIDSTLRRILTKDIWREYDLTSAQLGIAAVEWDVPEVLAFLENGGSVWKHMADYTGLGIEYKPLFKKAIYSTAYGSLQRSILNEHMPEEAESKSLRYRKDAEGAAIMDHPFLKQLIPTRNDQMERIDNDGGAYDTFGRWLSVRRITQLKRSRSGAIRSILAQMNQAIEMDLLMPALKLAKQELEKASPAWQIALYQYDGFSVKFHRSEEYHHKRIVDAVNERARKKGYPTRLEAK
jgi:hypothetical protein